MKLEIERSGFLKAWQTAEKYTPSKTTMDAINGIRIIAKDDSVTLEATDMKSSVKCTAKGAAILEPGVAVLNAALFGSMLRKSQAQTLTLSINDEKGNLVASRSKSRFTVIPVETFPDLPESSEAEEICSLMPKDLGQLINEGCCAASAPSDFPRYLGTCLLRTVEEKNDDGNTIGSKIIAVSTDGKRLACSQTACTSINKQEDILIPAAALKELAKIFSGDGEVKILANSTMVWFRLDDAEFSVRRIDASFPKYERILNNEIKTSMKVDKSALISAIDRVDIIAKTNPAVHVMAMTLNPEGELKITARSPEHGIVIETLEARIEGAPMQIGYNIAYFMDGIKSVNSDTVYIEFSEDEGQTRMFKDENKDFLYMLMPIRLTPQDIVSEEDSAELYMIPEPEESAHDEPQQQEQPENQEQAENQQEPHEFGEGNYDSEAPF